MRARHHTESTASPSTTIQRSRLTAPFPGSNSPPRSGVGETRFARAAVPRRSPSRYPHARKARPWTRASGAHTHLGKGSIRLAPIAFFDRIDSITRRFVVAGFRGFCIVAHAAAERRLLLRSRGDPKEKCELGSPAAATPPGPDPRASGSAQSRQGAPERSKVPCFARKERYGIGAGPGPRRHRFSAHPPLLFACDCDNQRRGRYWQRPLSSTAQSRARADGFTRSRTRDRPQPRACSATGAQRPSDEIVEHVFLRWLRAAVREAGFKPVQESVVELELVLECGGSAQSGRAVRLCRRGLRLHQLAGLRLKRRSASGRQADMVSVQRQAVTASGARCSLGCASTGRVRIGPISHRASSAPAKATAAPTLSPVPSADTNAWLTAWTMGGET